MEKLLLANTDLRVSRLIVGCMGLGGGWDKGVTLTGKNAPGQPETVKNTATLVKKYADARGRPMP